MSAPLMLDINGTPTAIDLPPDTPLLWALRQGAMLPGTRFGCGMALCGACTVHVDGAPVRACVTPVSAVVGRTITTIEGLEGPAADALREAWRTLDVAQCGYCQSGQLMSAAALLSTTPSPSDADIDWAIDGNVCRCGTYPRIRAAIKAAATKLSALALGAMALATVASPRLEAQAGAPIIGRWDLTVQGPEHPYPSWMEVTLSGHRTLVGRFVAGGGSARPVAKVTYADGRVQFSLPPQWEAEPHDVQVEATLRGDSLTGTITQPNGQRHVFTGVRAPALRRTAPPVWGAEVVLFDGTHMNAWTPLPGGTSQWRVIDGVLTNTRAGANLATTQRFTDFRLHVEFRVPAGGNSGIYLRGRHEVQVEDSPLGEPQSTHMGGVYGFLVPNEQAHTGPGTWQSVDITLVGRRVTVVLNGRTVIADQIIPGITGGALDSHEGEPGPIYLQGDHTFVEYRNIRITPVATSPR